LRVALDLGFYAMCGDEDGKKRKGEGLSQVIILFFVKFGFGKWTSFAIIHY